MIAAFTGGGGKTTLIYYLAEKFAGEGKKVIVTTTTHMAWEPGRPFADAGDAAGVRQLLAQYGYVTAAYHKAGQPKISGPDREILEKLSGLCDALLVEADGSKRLPLKVPAQSWKKNRRHCPQTGRCGRIPRGKCGGYCDLGKCG